MSDRRQLAPNDPRHGTSGGYTYWHCRCDACRGYWSDYNTRHRDKPVAFADPADWALAERFMSGDTAKHRNGNGQFVTLVDGKRDAVDANGRPIMSDAHRGSGVHRRGRTPKKHPR